VETAPSPAWPAAADRSGLTLGARGPDGVGRRVREPMPISRHAGTPARRPAYLRHRRRFAAMLTPAPSAGDAEKIARPPRLPVLISPDADGFGPMASRRIPPASSSTGKTRRTRAAAARGVDHGGTSPRASAQAGGSRLVAVRTANVLARSPASRSVLLRGRGRRARALHNRRQLGMSSDCRDLTSAACAALLPRTCTAVLKVGVVPEQGVTRAGHEATP
jgi:hypothetical protein